MNTFANMRHAVMIRFAANAAAAFAVAAVPVLAQIMPKTARMLDQTPPGAPLPASNSITDVVIDNNTIWLGTDKGLSVSSDGGHTWTNFYNTPPFGTESVSAIVIKDIPLLGKKVMWVGTAHTEEVNTGLQTISVAVGSGLRYRYFSGGDTAWHSVPQPMDSNSAKTIQYGNTSYSSLPIIVPEQNVVYDIAVTPSGNVFIASWAGGVRETTDNGATWRRVMLPGDSIDYLTPDSTYASLQLSPVVNKNQEGFSVLALSDSEIFAGTAGGINKSTDGGVSWFKMNHRKYSGISGNFITQLARQPSTGTIWAATVDADKSADSTEQRSISFSADDGRSWRTINALRGEFAHNFGFAPGIVYCATDTGLYRSCDGGLTWTVQNLFADSVRHERVTMLPVYAAGVLPADSVLFIGTEDGLVTAKATCIDKPLYNVFQASARLQSGSDTYAYPNPFSPALGVTRVHYRVADPGVEKTGLVTIDIFDFAMNPVRTLIRNAPRTNDTELNEIWDGTTEAGVRAANGVYFYSVRVDGGDRRWGKILVIQ